MVLQHWRMKTHPHFLLSLYKKLYPEPQLLCEWVNTKTNPTSFWGAARDTVPGAQGKGWQSLQSPTDLWGTGHSTQSSCKGNKNSGQNYPEAELHFVHHLLLLLFTLKCYSFIQTWACFCSCWGQVLKWKLRSNKAPYAYHCLKMYYTLKLLA